MIALSGLPGLPLEHELGLLPGWSLSAEGDLEQQSLQASGTVRYRDGLAWNLSLGLEELAMPAQLDPLVGQLSGTLQASGELTQGQWWLALSRLALRGDINELPAKLSGDLQVDHTFNLDGSDLSVELNGSSILLVDREGVLPGATIMVSDFSRWAEGAGGSLQATLSWDRESQRFMLDGSTSVRAWGHSG